MSDDADLLLSIWAYDAKGRKVHPYKGARGAKKGLYSVNFTNDTKKFQALSEGELVRAIETGRFHDRGTIRMRPVNRSGVNAFAPLMYGDRKVKSF